MKTLLFIAFVLFSLSLQAANPTFQSFDTNAFNVNASGNTIGANTSGGNPNALVKQSQITAGGISLGQASNVVNGSSGVIKTNGSAGGTTFTFSDTGTNAIQLIAGGGITNSALTASTDVEADANKRLSSLPNALGVKTNNSSGIVGWSTGIPASWIVGATSGGSLFPPNAAGVLINDGSGVTNWLSTNTIINVASNNAVNALPSSTNFWGITNGPTSKGQAVVVDGIGANGVWQLKGTNWPSMGSTPNGLVTNFGVGTVIVPTPLIVTNTSEGDSMRINAQLDTVAGAFVSGNNFETLLLSGKTNGTSSSASGVTANILHIQNPRGGILLETDSQIISSNSTTKTYTQMDTNNVWHFGSNSVETVSIAPVTGTVTASNFNANGSGGSSNWLGGISFIASNAAPSTLVAPSGLNSITMNQPWTNNFNRLADLEVSALFTDAVTGNPGLGFTNTVTGQSWTNSPLSALIAGTSQITIVIPDISPNDFGSFSNYSGTGASVVFVKAWWHLK